MRKGYEIAVEVILTEERGIKIVGPLLLFNLPYPTLGGKLVFLKMSTCVKILSEYTLQLHKKSFKALDDGFF